MSEVFLWKDISAAEDKMILLLSFISTDIVLVVPKATLGCGDSLEGHTGLRKALILTVTVY